MADDRSFEEDILHQIKGIRGTQRSMLELYEKIRDKVTELEKDVMVGNYSEKIAELKEWKKEVEKIAPGVVLAELVEEMKSNRKVRNGMAGVIAAMTIVDMVLKFFPIK